MGGAQKGNVMGRELYVGHMSYETTEEDMRRLFSVAGTVTSVHVITDPQTGKSKGCGYVRMATADEVKEAIDSLDGALLDGRIIAVSEARPQKERVRPSGARKRKADAAGHAGRGRK